MQKKPQPPKLLLMCQLMQYTAYVPDDGDLVNTPIPVKGGECALIVLRVLLKF